MDDLVEVARFMYPSDADVLESLFQKENIEYILEGSNIIPGAEARLMVNSDDVPKAVAVIKEGGFEEYLNEDI